MKSLLLIVSLTLFGGVCLSQEINQASRSSADAKSSQLTTCIKSGDAGCVKAALALGASANAVDENGLSAIRLAADGEDVRIVTLLVNAGADVNLPGEGQDTALCRAALFGRKEMVELLISAGAKVDIVCSEDHGDTPLMDALRGALLNGMPQPLREDYAVSASGDSSSNEGSGQESKGSNDMEKFVSIDASRFLETARVLLSHGADVNVVANCDVGETALMYAALAANVEMVKAILARGVKVEIVAATLSMMREFELEAFKTKLLSLPALSREQEAALAWSEHTKEARDEITKLLIATGAKIPLDPQDEEAPTVEEAQREAIKQAFHDTIERDDIADLNRLINAYAAHPVGSLELHDALRMAVIYRRINLVKRLLAAGVDPNGASDKPLLYAANAGDLELIEVLLDAGADINATDDNGQTALDCVEKWKDSSGNHDEVAMMLKARGGKNGKRK